VSLTQISTSKVLRKMAKKEIHAADQNVIDRRIVQGPKYFVDVHENVARCGLLRRGSLVRLAGLEPARVTPLPPQSSVSANSTISATRPYFDAALRVAQAEFFSDSACLKSSTLRHYAQVIPDGLSGDAQSSSFSEAVTGPRLTLSPSSALPT
jgi:hypothetical protein